MWKYCLQIYEVKRHHDDTKDSSCLWERSDGRTELGEGINYTTENGLVVSKGFYCFLKKPKEYINMAKRHWFNPEWFFLDYESIG